ncbi:MAG: hypothetical protein H5T44_03180 [Thermoplasmatales archaeon]|nr:hypothetical protein [Thermoplasmatales archaeon]
MKNKGILETPVQYLIMIIIASLAISIISFALYKTWRNYRIEEAEKEIRKIISEANLMAAQAEEGTRKSMEVNIGKDVSFVEIRDKSIRIVMKWNENRVLYSDVNLRCDQKIYPGKNFLTLELKKNGEKYVEIQVGE